MPYRLAIAQQFLMGRPVGIEPTTAGATIRCVNPFATAAIYGRGSRNRTHIDGFGDRSSTVKLYPYYNIKDGGGGQIRTAEPRGSGFTVRRV